MVMPIAEAVLQQLICTGLADSQDDSETAEGPEEDSGTSGSVAAGGKSSNTFCKSNEVKIDVAAMLAPTLACEAR